MTVLPDSVRFLPWVGSDYVTGKGLLVMGESHYSRNVNEPRNFTQQLTADYVAGNMKHRFWTRVARVITGCALTRPEARAYWRQLSFYNYIQGIVGPTARHRPSDASWRNSEEAFYAVLSRLRPAHLLVLGVELWRRSPPGVSAQPPLTLDHPKRRYDVADGHLTRATYVPHPASFGFSWRKWHPVVSQLVIT